MTRSPGSDVADVWRRDWPLRVVALTMGAVVVLLCVYLVRRQQVVESRAERQRQAICAILANIPGRIPPEIAHARSVFAPAGHPAACMPIPRPKPTSVRSGTTTTTTTSTTVLIVPPVSQEPGVPTPAASPHPTRSTSPQPAPTPSRSPTPSPSPTGTCVPVPLVPLCIPT